jgi:histone-lysine N-methyltransferase SETD8
VNHSATEFNATPKVVEIKGKPHLCLFASRDIHVGKEVLFDYGERRKDVVHSLPWLKL